MVTFLICNLNLIWRGFTDYNVNCSGSSHYNSTGSRGNYCPLSLWVFSFFRLASKGSTLSRYPSWPLELSIKSYIQEKVMSVDNALGTHWILLQVAIVVGGGNFFRGANWVGSSGLDRASADQIGYSQNTSYHPFVIFRLLEYTIKIRYRICRVYWLCDRWSK